MPIRSCSLLAQTDRRARSAFHDKYTPPPTPCGQCTACEPSHADWLAAMKVVPTSSALYASPILKGIEAQDFLHHLFHFYGKENINFFL